MLEIRVMLKQYSHNKYISLVALFVLLICTAGQANAQERITLGGHRTAASENARIIGPVAPSEPIALTLALTPRDPQGLETLLQRLYDPSDPLYRHFLTPEQFTARFGPTQTQYDIIEAFARTRGLTITETSSNRLLLGVEAPSATVEMAFGVHLQHLLDRHGRRFHAPDSEPKVPASISALLTSVVGLDDSAVWQPQSVSQKATLGFNSLAAPLQIGTGPNGGLSPTDIRTAYGLANLPAGVNGAGQTLALFELDGYKPADIIAYENQFQSQLGVMKFPIITPVPIDGGSGALGGGQAEVTLDIELQIALAPAAGAIQVYEGPNSGIGLLDTYNQIALDDTAKQISTSWGLAEDETGSSFLTAEAPIFAEMAAQGQTIYAASGDSGALDDGKALSVDDPASQPYVTGTGGTTLSLGAGGGRASEAAWSDSGGGASAFWPIPYWQLPVVATDKGSNASFTMRNVPDVSLDANPNTGYAIYLNGDWTVYGGTSCAAPLWAAFTALVNQERAANNEPALGFANPLLYAIGAGQFGSDTNDFYDVTKGSNGGNGFYSAVSGYDDVTGLGTFNGASLLIDLVAGPNVGPILTGSANASGVTLSWTAVSGAVSYSVYRATTSGAEGATPLIAGLAGTSDTDTTVTADTAYYYVVTAVNASGVTVPSNELAVTPSASLSVQNVSANPTAVTGKTTALSVQATAPQGQTLSYTWAATGPAPVSYSVNGTIAASGTTATFTKAGTYLFTVTVTNSAGLSVTGTVSVTVNQTVTKLSITPPSVTLTTGQTQQFTATANDQFGNALTASPTWTTNGGGIITSNGLFTATTPGGPDTLTATQAGVRTTAQVTVVAAVNASAFISQSVPSSMVAGQTYSVSVTYQNTGTTTWTSAAAYHLGSQDPQDNTTWALPVGGGRVLLPAGTSVAPGQSVTFTFNVKAPAKAGTYPIQWRVVQDGVQWFGAFTPIVNVSVTS
jgi:hypothetical protein